MSTPAWAELEALFHEALAQLPGKRAAFVAERCAGRPALQAELDAMLRAHDEAASALNVSAISAPPALNSGARLGAYEILGRLGAGGMGEVYRARDTRLGRDVAIKVLPPGFVADTDRLARFEREARVLAALNHPNIGAIYGVEECEVVVSGFSRTIRALVLELVEGDTLAHRIARGPVPVTDALTIARQIAKALEAAHEKGIVHRDLKPANIKVAPNGTVKVLDFGLAKLTQASGPGPQAPDLTASPTITIDRTALGVIAGTPAYMSPEQARGQAVDKRTDIWAFGCVLYEMLTGQAAFRGATISDTIAAILDREPDVNALSPTIASAVRVLLRRCLQKDANRRLHDIADARLEIEDAISHAAQDDGIPHTRTAFAYGRHRVAWGIVAGVAILASVALGLLTLLSTERAAPTADPIRFEVPTPPTVDPASFALSADGRHLAFVATTDGDRRLFVRPLGELTARALPGTEGALFPFWSPDGRALGFFAEGTLKRIDVTGGAAQVLAEAVGWGATWSTQGAIVFAPMVGGPLLRVAASGGRPVPVTRSAPGHLNDAWPQFLPDGRRFLFFRLTNSADKTGVYLGSIDGSDPTAVMLSETAVAYAPPGVLLQLRQDGALVAFPFDATRGVLAGDPIAVAHTVGNGGFPPLRGTFAASATGVLAYRMRGGERLRQLAWFDRAGVRQGTVGPPLPGYFSEGEMSPDGRRIGVERFISGNQSDLWLLDVGTGTPTRYTFHPGNEWAPVWSPDGRRVVFSSDRNGVDDLFEKPANGSSDEMPLLVTPQPKKPISWTRDGQFLLYTLRDPKILNTDLWALPFGGDRKPFPVVQTPSDESWGQFSPDGRWVAYQSNESGRSEVYLQAFPGPGGRRQLSTTGGSQVRWRPDGRELFYVAADDRLMAVAVTPGADGQLETGAPAPLFRTQIGPYFGTTAQYVVTSDGRFLMNVVVEAPQVPAITVVLNWDSVLGR